MKSIFTFILLLVIGSASTTAQINTLERYLLSAAKLELRTGPGANYNIIGEIPQGTQVYVISSGYGEWSTVQYKNGNGFVKTSLLIEDNSLAEADRIAKEAEDRKNAARQAAEAAIRAAEAAKIAAAEAARKAIAAAEKLQRQAEADATAAAAAAAAANQNKTAAERRREAEYAETERALREANQRVAQSGSIANTSIESTTPSYGGNSKNSARTVSAAPSSVKREDNYSSWVKKTYKSGVTPKSFNFKGKYEYKLDNYLKIEVGKNTDIVMKLIKQGKTEKDDETVRIVYINSNQTQYIRNIPEGEYYYVIAYGKDWREGSKSGQGTFTKNALYEKGKDILNYNTIKTADGINVPNYSLQLDLMPNGSLQEGNYSDDISPDKFNEF